MSFKLAIEDFRYLKNRNYPDKAALKLVSDHHRLSAIQRNCLFRAIFSASDSRQRKAKLSAAEDVEGQLLGVDWYNVLIKVLNGDIKGLTSELVGIDKKKLESLQKVSYLIKDYKRIRQTKEMLDKIIYIYTTKLPLLVQDENFTTRQAAVIVESFDLVLDDSRQLVSSILNTIVEDDLFMMDDKQRYDAINGIYTDVKKH